MPLSVEQLEKRVVEMANLPTLPGVLKKIAKMTEDRESSAADVARVVSADQVLSAKVLRLVNSPVYGFPGRISSVTHAVVLLGFNVLKGLVMGTAVFDTIGPQGKGLWQHSIGCAVLSRRLATTLGLPDPEEIMVGGLLHDLGKVVLAHVAPDLFAQALQTAKEARCHIGTAEHTVFGVNHTRVAAWLADEWHFPARLAEPLAYHHNPDRAKSAKEATDVVHLADILARGMGYGDPGDPTMPEISHEAYQRLGASFAQIDKVLEDAESEYAAAADILGL